MLHPAHVSADPFPVDPLLIDYWDPADNASIVLAGGAFLDSIKGKKLGVSVPAVTSGRRPNYIVDPVLGVPVFQTTTTGTRCMANTAIGSTLAASGSRPYSLSAFRLHITPSGGATYGIFSIGVSGSAESHYVHYQTSGGNELRPYYNGNAANVSATASATTTVRVVEFWADGTNLNCRDNGTLTQTATNVSLGANCTGISFGRAISADTHVSNCNHLFHALWSAKPADAIIRRALQWLAEFKHTNKFTI